VKLKSKKEISKLDETYNLHIKDDHNYIANDAVVSNCHMAKAEVLTKLLTENLRNAPIRWGLTGTVPKEDFEFQGILAAIGPVVGNIAAHELQEKGVLAHLQVNIVQLLDMKEFRNYQEELKYLVTNEDRIQQLASLFNNIRQTGNTLILVDRIATGKRLEELIDGSVFINGEMKVKDRQEEYDDVNSADHKVIIATYGVAAVGINIPRIFNLVLVEPGKSFVRVIQSIGRGIRKAKDKDFVQIWDITSSCKFAKRHLRERKKYYKEAQYPFAIEKLDWQ
jgi:superfamily II DNA or RNA helicase